MRHTKLLLVTLATVTTVTVTGLVISNTKTGFIMNTHGEIESYKLVCSNGVNQLHNESRKSGETTLKTKLGNNITFQYNNVIGNTTSWHTLGIDTTTSEGDVTAGYFYNTDAINGIQSITLTFNTTGKDYQILYSRDNSFNKSKTLTTPSAAATQQVFDFDGYLPCYFKVLNTSGVELDISSMIIDFSCINNYQVLTLTNENEEMGTVTGSGVMIAGEQVTITATANTGYKFDGWYDGEQLISESNPYSFTMPSSGVTYKAVFSVEETTTIEGATPVIDTTANTVTYGLYPQTYVSDTTLTAELDKLTTTESNTWYLYNNAYYAKLSANPYESNYTFDDGTTIVSGATYWFKCEPITWNILKTNNNEYTLLSNVLLDAHRYGENYSGTKTKTDYNGETATVYANNYKYSEIRTWLNTDFYNSTFALNNSYIQTIEVDNSTSTTFTWSSTSSNSYACENTNDKVYLLSYQDYLNTSYGFTDNSPATTTRECKTTDYARANGAYYNTNSSYLYNGWYWTRSPHSGGSNAPMTAFADGHLNCDYVNYTNYSVRPSITIKIN